MKRESAIRSLEVTHTGGSYRLEIGEDLSESIRCWWSGEEARGVKGALLLDEGVKRALGDRIEALFPGVPSLVVPAGESSKSWDGLIKVVDFLADSGLDRDGVLWVVGGGVVGDLGGFAAAVYLRGVRCVQVPTTLLAMVDSSIGGKTGINLRAGKNLAGAFHPPARVFIQTGWLATLPPREFSAGMAEIIKYGLLAEPGLFDELEALMEPLHPGHPELPEVIRRCCSCKARIVGADEHEKDSRGGRALLNLGHTFGHAIERVGGYGSYLHGEAVAIGLVMAARLSVLKGALPMEEEKRVEGLLARYGLPVSLPEPLPVKDLLEAMRHDKKVKAGRLRFILLEELGRAVVREDISEAEVTGVLKSGGAV